MSLCRLFGKDYANFVSVWRSWRSSTSPPLRLIPSSCFSTKSETIRYPSLFHFSGNSPKCKFYDPSNNSSYVSQIPEELIDSRICFSNHGWLLMSQKEQLFFFHPFTHQRIVLPSMTYIITYSRMCFSSPPTSPDCLVFNIGDAISVIRRGQDSWENIPYNSRNVCVYSSLSTGAGSNPVFYKGAFYCVGSDKKLGVFDSCSLKIIDNLEYPYDWGSEYFLVESNGELLLICMGGIGEFVRIFRLNLDNEIRCWEEVHSLGDNMIFASRTGCLSMQTDTMGNTIYFPSFDNEGNGLFYSLASCKFHSVGSALAKEDLCNTKQMLHCAWIKPTASEIYMEDELRWLPNPETLIPSNGRVKVKKATHAHPSFVLANLDKPENQQLYLNVFGNPHNVEGIPEVCKMYTETFAFGWLLKVGWNNSDCLLINPQTMEKIQLPQLPDWFSCNNCAISSSPSDPNCTVMFIRYYRYGDCDDDELDIIYCRPGEGEWTTITMDPAKRYLFCKRFCFFSKVIGYQGKIYGIYHDGFEMEEIDFDPIFDVEDVRFDKDRRALPRTSSLGTTDETIYMFESCGEFFLVRISYYGPLGSLTKNLSKISEVDVFKLDFTGFKWETVGSLSDDIAFFCYDEDFCFSSSSMETSKRKGNSIYFISGPQIYAFDFEDGSISIPSTLNS